ncbi:MAG: hypothetical protein ACXVLQ_17265, partial [Bacteriovorax sp.]
MLLKKLLSLLDLFLPAQLNLAVEAPLLYRARVIVAITMVSIVSAIALMISTLILKLSLAVSLGVLFCIFILVGHLYFLKKQTKNFERYLLIGGAVQILAVSSMIYLTAFSEKGTGFFGLIWLLPIFLMMAFYFKTRFGFYFMLVNLILLFGVGYLNYGRFFEPLQRLSNFASVFLIFLTLVIVLAYMIAFLFVHLSDELQKEVVKQRDLLVESAKFQSLGQ